MPHLVAACFHWNGTFERLNTVIEIEGVVLDLAVVDEMRPMLAVR